MHPRHQIAKEGEQEAGVWWHWFISSVGCQEGKVTCPWPTAWVVTVFTSCISRNEGMFIPKQSSALEFNGLPSPLAFNFCCVISPASSLCQERAGRRARLGMYRNIPIGNITWSNLHENVVWPRFAPKAARMQQAPSPPPWGGSAAQAPPAFPTPWPQSPSARAAMLGGGLGTRAGSRAVIPSPAGDGGGIELECGHLKPPLLRGFLQPWSTCAFGGYF